MALPFSGKNTRKIKKSEKHAGEVRRSQLTSSFGIGSIVDFLKDTVIIASGDNWDEGIEGNRLNNENLQSITGAKFFLQPKVGENYDKFKKSKDIPAYIFPEKLYCPKCNKIFDAKELQDMANSNKCLNPDCKNSNLVASRFVVVCENGHIEDFPYDWWIHHGECCKSNKEKPRLKMYNVGYRSDIDSLYVQCEECGEKRPMAQAFNENIFGGANGYQCRGNHPHFANPKSLGHECTENLRTRLRNSSSIYFPVVRSALSIPPWSRLAVQKILENYGALSRMTQEKQADFIEHDILPKMRNKVKLDDLLLALDVVSRQKNLSQMRTEKEIYFDEYNALRRGGKCEEEEFVAFETNIPTGFGNFFDKIVVVEKLIVIQALCGFTRLKPWSGETLDDKKIAPIFAGERDWLPAVKLSGEGIFIQLNQQKIDEWCERMGGRYDTFNTNYRKSYFRSAKFSTQYVMLHSFAHLFIRQLAHECGYSASSMRERIYSTFNGDESPKMCGVLVYLSTPDSEGSLGGLIGIPQNIAVMEKILTEMLEKALWCSADPLCINSTEQGLDSLNLSACHDCTLLPETSCEFRNILLDRAAIVGTPENRELGFFSSAIMTASISDRR